MPFTYEKIQYRSESCIEITGFTGAARHLSVPERIEGLPVRSIGRHAFAGRGDLQEVYLPGSVRRLNLFAFHNCPNLRRMTVFDSVEDYYDGVIRQCSALDEIEMHCSGRSYALMKEMLGDNDKAMSFLLHIRPSADQSGSDQDAPDQKEEEEDIRLSFPDYALIASENTMARTIQFAYEGGGYQYRQCVRKTEIRYREYDRLFPFMEHDDPSFAAVIATDRLMYPHDLDPAAESKYTAFLREHAEEALKRFIVNSQIERVRLITDKGLADAEAVAAALRTASERKETAICALLMDEGRRSREGAASLTLELEDW